MIINCFIVDVSMSYEMLSEIENLSELMVNLNVLSDILLYNMNMEYN